MDHNVDIDKINEYLYNQIENTTWSDLLSDLIYSEIPNITKKLLRLREDGKRFTPKIKELFRPFEKCELNNTKVVIINPEPYPFINSNDGLALSSNEEQIALSIIFDSFEKNYSSYNREPNLERWSKQGVLLLNSSFTVEINKVNTHHYIWRKFFSLLLMRLLNKQFCFILIGNKSKEFTQFLKGEFILFIEHPMSAYLNNKTWDNFNVFDKANHYLQTVKKDNPIIW